MYGPLDFESVFCQPRFWAARVCVSNKAHTAAVHRIATRYRGAVRQLSAGGHGGDNPDILLPDGRIDVETSATLADRIASLKSVTGRRFVAVTNKESLAEAVRLATGTGIGVMDSHGEVVLDAAR
jgi:hypothetical protein